MCPIIGVTFKDRYTVPAWPGMVRSLSQPHTFPVIIITHRPSLGNTVVRWVMESILVGNCIEVIQLPRRPIPVLYVWVGYVLITGVVLDNCLRKFTPTFVCGCCFLATAHADTTLLLTCTILTGIEIGRKFWMDGLQDRLRGTNGPANVEMVVPY